MPWVVWVRPVPGPELREGDGRERRELDPALLTALADPQMDEVALDDLGADGGQLHASRADREGQHQRPRPSRASPGRGPRSRISPSSVSATGGFFTVRIRRPVVGSKSTIRRV